jgi:protein-tyrosine-phosphatase
MTIHFICKGNTFRSRLAEAYLNSKQTPNLKVISSGIEAEVNECGPIAWYAQRILQNNNLIPFEKPVWEQTTKLLLEKGDLTIFMHQNIYNYAVKHFGFDGKDFEIWEIPDIRIHLLTLEQEFDKIEATEKIYAEIKQKIDELIKEII